MSSVKPITALMCWLINFGCNQEENIDFLVNSVVPFEIVLYLNQDAIELFFLFFPFSNLLYGIPHIHSSILKQLTNFFQAS